MSDSPTPTPDQLREHMRLMLEHPIAPQPTREAVGISLDSLTDEQVFEAESVSMYGIQSLGNTLFLAI